MPIVEAYIDKAYAASAADGSSDGLRLPEGKLVFAAIRHVSGPGNASGHVGFALSWLGRSGISIALVPEQMHRNHPAQHTPFTGGMYVNAGDMLAPSYVNHTLTAGVMRIFAKVDTGDKPPPSGWVPEGTLQLPEGGAR